MRVLIFEPQFKGHNLVYAARLLRAVAELGCEPVLATSTQAAASSEFELHFGGLRDAFTLHAMRGFRTDLLGLRLKTNGVGGAAQVYRALKRAITDTRPGHVYVPYGNFLARTAALPFGLTGALRRCNAEAETLLISGRYLQPKTSPLAKLRRWALLELIGRGPWSSVFHLDDVAVDQFQAHGGRVAGLGRLMPDPHSPAPRVSRRDARAYFGLPANGRAVVVTGLIEGRKGVRELLAAFAAASGRLREDDRLWLIGPHHPSLLRTLGAAGPAAERLIESGRVQSIDRRLSSDEIGLAIRAGDVLANLYLNHPYTSSILIAGAAAGRPVLGIDSGWIGRTIERFSLGHSCDPGDTPAVADALVASLDASSHYRPAPEAERFVEFSTDENYAAHWTARLRERLGVAPSPRLRAWDWVRGQEVVSLPLNRSDPDAPPKRWAA